MTAYLAQGIGFIGMIFVFIAFQNNKKKKILLFQAVAGAVFTIHFFLLGAFTGAGMNAVEVVRNLVFYREWKTKLKVFWIVLFAAVFTVSGAATWQNPISLLPIVAMNLSTVAFSFRDPKYIRLLFLPVATGWLIYNIVSFSIAGILTEVFDLASLLIAFWRFDILKKQQPLLDE